MFEDTDGIRRIINNVNEGEEISHKLSIDPETGKLMPKSPYIYHDNLVNVTQEDIGLAQQHKDIQTQVVLQEYDFKSLTNSSDCSDVILFGSHDDNTVLSTFLTHKTRKGQFKRVIDVQSVEVPSSGELIQIFYSINVQNPKSKSSSFFLEGTGWITIRAFLKRESTFVECDIHVIPAWENIYTRNRGILETDTLANKTVAIAGIGSFGSIVAIQLAQAGIFNFILIDHDRMEPGNVIRHACDLRDTGRYKTKAVRDRILSINPYANVETYEFAVNWENYDSIKNICENADLIIDLVDNQEARIVSNKIFFEINKTCIRAGFK